MDVTLGGGGGYAKHYLGIGPVQPHDVYVANLHCSLCILVSALEKSVE